MWQWLIYKQVVHIECVFWQHQIAIQQQLSSVDNTVHKNILVWQEMACIRPGKQFILWQNICISDNTLFIFAYFLIYIVGDKKCRDYMVKYLTMISCVSTVLCIKSGTPQHLAEKQALWEYMKEKNMPMFKLVASTLMGRVMQFKSRLGHKFILFVYSTAQKIFVFN